MKPLKQDMDDVHSPPNDGTMNGQTHEPLSGLTSLISFNTEGFSREKAGILSSLCRVNNCAVLLLQETHRGPTRNRPKIPGMNLIVERPHDQYGSAIYVKPGLDVNNTNIYSDNNMEILSINLEGFTVTSIYKPPNTPFTYKDPPCHQSIEIIMGDFNSHNTIWGYDETNENGKALENWMDIKNLELIHDPKQPSSFNSQRHKRGYNPDLLFASQEIAPNCNKITLDAVPRSQHCSIALKTSPLISPQNTYFKRRFNFRKANWKGFKAESDSLISRLKPKPENYDKFVKLLKKSARKYIPRGCRIDYIPGLTKETKLLYDKYQNKFKENPFSEDTIELGESIMVHLAAVQQERWIHFVESTDLTQNSRKAWHNIRKISNDPTKPNSQYEVTANQVAHVLIKNGKTQVMKKQSKIEIPYSKYNTDEHKFLLSEEFTLHELDEAIKTLVNGKAAGIDDINTELLKQLGPNCRKWLLKMFHTCIRENNIPKV